MRCRLDERRVGGVYGDGLHAEASPRGKLGGASLCTLLAHRRMDSAPRRPDAEDQDFQLRSGQAFRADTLWRADLAGTSDSKTNREL
jgi:hypothetical protein